MILNRLYELANREHLLDDAAFESQAVPYVVIVDEGGVWLPPVFEQRGETVTVKKTKKGEEVKRTPDKGVVRTVPRPHGDPAQRGFARYFVDTLPRVLPVTVDEKDREKVERSRATFWKQIETAADATDDPGLRAVQAFGRLLADNPDFAAQIRDAVAEREPDAGDRVTFAYYPDGGTTILERPAVRTWYAGFFRQFTESKQTGGTSGFCTITGTVGPLPTTHPIKLSGVPGGLPTGVSLVSFDKAAFQHYGLDGAANAAIGYTAADGYARGFQWLRGRRNHCFVFGGTLFLFWTRTPSDTCDMMAIGEPKADQVERLLSETAFGKWTDPVDDVNDFYLLAVSGNSARMIVRDYLETTLGNVRKSIRGWFADLRIADPSKQFLGQPNAAFPLWLLANATAREADGVAPNTHSRLFRAALTGGPLPNSILAACLGRLRAEGSEGFQPARMGLIKLCLNRTQTNGGTLVSDKLDPDETHPAYVYGRLLALFDQIQYAALRDVNASVVDKFYSTLSAAPASVFGRVAANAQNHLRKLRKERPGKYIALEKRLLEVRGLLGAAPPPARLSLQDQGRFALGFYFEKAKGFEEIANRKREKAEKAAQ